MGTLRLFAGIVSFIVGGWLFVGAVDIARLIIVPYIDPVFPWGLRGWITDTWSVLLWNPWDSAIALALGVTGGGLVFLSWYVFISR